MTVGSTCSHRIWYQALTLDFAALGTMLRRRLELEMIAAGTVKDLIAVVFGLGGLPFTGAAFAVVRLEQDGNGDDGKYWDETGASWEVALTVNQVSTHLEAGQHVYQLPAAATTGRAGAAIHFTFTDDLTEADSTTVCAGGEHDVSAGSLTDIQAAIDRVLGLVQNNYMLDEQEYDDEGLLLTGRVRVFANATALGAATAGAADDADSEIARYNIIVIAATAGEATDYRFAQEL